MTSLVTPAPPKELPSPEVIAKVFLDGDLSKLTPAQMVSYYGGVCDSVGLNPLTKPFEFLKLSGKLVLYATRNCTDQLRKIYNISVAITAREEIADVYVVTARATMPNGRHDESTGAVAIANLKGEFRANAMLKAETKSKRRVTLSLVGLSTLDESEVESIPGAVPVPTEPPALARERALNPEPGPGAPAAPADLNNALPEAWMPFVLKEPDAEYVRGVVAMVDEEKKTGKKSGQEYVKTNVTLASGETLATLSRDFASVARDCFVRGTPVEIRTKPTRWGKEIVSIARLPEEGDDAPL